MVFCVDADGGLAGGQPAIESRDTDSEYVRAYEAELKKLIVN